MLRMTLRTICLLGAVGATLPTAAWAQASTEEPAARTHTVRPGDTLWGLAARYLGDPFLWPDIYRLNTMVVEDPHWIYPGEVLRLSGSDAVASVPAQDTPAAPDAVADSMGSADPAPAADVAVGEDAVPARPLAFLGTRHRLASEPSLNTEIEDAYRPIRRSEFYSAGFLTEGREVVHGTMAGTVTPPQIRSSSARSSATLFSTVMIAPPAGTTYQIGDSLIIAHEGPRFEGWGRTVVPSGMARIEQAADGGRFVASVVAVYGPIRSGQMVLPAERFPELGKVRAVPVADGVNAAVIGFPTRHELVSPQDVIFLDKGSADGLAPGDIVELRRTPARFEGSAEIDELMATLQVVRTGEHSASAIVLTVPSPDIPAGTRARQVAKLPS